MSKSNSRWVTGSTTPRYDKKTLDQFAEKREDAGWVKAARVKPA